MNVLNASKPPDVPVQPGPDDSVSKLAFNPVADFLAVGSWDNQVRVYEVSAGTGQVVPKASVQHDGPALGLAWSKDGTKLLTCSADKTAKILDLQTGQPAQQIAAHEGPISCVKYLEVAGQQVAVTAGWDKMVKYWDMRTPNPIAQLTAPERVYALDAVNDLMVFGTADRQICLVDLKNPGVIKSSKESPLKMQTRVITAFPSGDGYAVGSVEGRVAIQYADEKNQAQNFSFKCHRGDPVANASIRGQTDTAVYAVNAIEFNRAHGTFVTAGSDGTLSFWDKDQRTRLKTYNTKDLQNGDANQKIPATPIVDASFSKDSNLLAYAFSYDWSKGYTGAIPSNKTQVMLHQVLPDEIKPKKK
ncbi:RNA export factor gle2 [Naganishia albida]|nr:RNA export factor gle2 [Naganishia albida]